MRAFAYLSQGQAGWIEKEIPKPTGVDGVIRPLLVAPCTSPHRILGHEGLGEIVAVGEGVKDFQVGEIVVGLPKNMDGTEGVRAELCREFADRLRVATGLPVSMWDERRTTVEAHNILSQHNYHGKKRKDTVDAVAASLILEGYLAYKKRNG